MGMVCRKDITARLSDPKLKPMRLTLQQVETSAFAERLTRARADAEIAVIGRNDLRTVRQGRYGKT